MDLYYFLSKKHNDSGCLYCPFAGVDKECDQGGGYTQMDEHGSCPVKDINTDDEANNVNWPFEN